MRPIAGFEPTQLTLRQANAAANIQLAQAERGAAIETPLSDSRKARLSRLRATGVDANATIQQSRRQPLDPFLLQHCAFGLVFCLRQNAQGHSARHSGNPRADRCGCGRRSMAIQTTRRIRALPYVTYRAVVLSETVDVVSHAASGSGAEAGSASGSSSHQAEAIPTLASALAVFRPGERFRLTNRLSTACGTPVSAASSCCVFFDSTSDRACEPRVFRTGCTRPNYNDSNILQG